MNRTTLLFKIGKYELIGESKDSLTLNSSLHNLAREKNYNVILFADEI